MTVEKKLGNIGVVEKPKITECSIMIRRKCKKSKQNLQEVAKLAELIYDNPPPDDVLLKLSDVSHRDDVWDIHRNHTADVTDIYAGTQYQRYSDRMNACSSYLEFGIDTEKGIKLKRSFFCHVRNCPVCQWRKSLYWKARAYQSFDELQKQYSTYRWLFLTLTVQNCHITDLRGTLQNMRIAWKKLTKRKEFRNVVGWIRTTEVTRDKKCPTTHAHPHYHVILMVKPAYFTRGNYLSLMDWVRVWQECLKVSYSPNVDIRIVRSKTASTQDLRSAIAETLKYAVKASDMIGDGTPQSRQWFLEYTKQVYKMRFVATGGLLKDVLKDDDISDTDMIALGDEDSSDKDDKDKRLLHFTYRKTHRAYIYNPSNNT